MTKFDLTNRLQQALSMLAAAPDDQIEYLETLGVAPSVDELALELNDLVRQVPVAVQAGVLSAEAEMAIRRVDEKLDSMSGVQHSDLWWTDRLVNSQEWKEVRKLANEALEHFA